MRFLLDTNALSEGAKPRPDRSYTEWLASANPDEMAVSVITFGEVKRGIELLPVGRKRAKLENWLGTTLYHDFRGRVLRVNADIALMWGRLTAADQKRGRVLKPGDGLVLATAAVHGLTIVTRNERDFVDRGVPVLNPWTLAA